MFIIKYITLYINTISILYIYIYIYIVYMYVINRNRIDTGAVLSIINGLMCIARTGQTSANEYFIIFLFYA